MIVCSAIIKTAGDWGEIVAALSDIQSRIESAIRRDRISVVKKPDISDEA